MRQLAEHHSIALRWMMIQSEIGGDEFAGGLARAAMNDQLQDQNFVECRSFYGCIKVFVFRF